MRAPVHRLAKTDIIWLSSHTCKAHHHAYLEHYQCYLNECPDETRFGFYDIEASHLTADIGIMLSYCIKPMGDGDILEGVITKRDINKAGLKGDEDRRIVNKMVEDMQKFDVLVGYFSSRFDMPFIRTRAVSMGIQFPYFGSIKHVDAYFLIRNRFCLISKRLESAQRALMGKTDKTRIEWKIWRAAARGNPKALAYVEDHNRKDVTDLEKLLLHVRDYAKRNEVSI